VASQLSLNSLHGSKVGAAAHLYCLRPGTDPPHAEFISSVAHLADS
jgi:hypothetical protein